MNLTNNDVIEVLVISVETHCNVICAKIHVNADFLVKTSNRTLCVLTFEFKNPGIGSQNTS